jgi:hypothetical protein
MPALMQRENGMLDREESPMLLVASKDELPPSQRIWGTGGWLPPEEREALDWLTFGRLSGWGVKVRYPKRFLVDEISGAQGFQWIVLACDPSEFDGESSLQLEWYAEHHDVLVVGRATTTETPLANWCRVRRCDTNVQGKSLRWMGPGRGRKWTCRRQLTAQVLDVPSDGECWATLEREPIVVAKQVGKGWVASLGFHPSRLRDMDGAATSLLRQLLVCGASRPIAWLDFENSLVLRMDDPGGAQNVHSKDWAHKKLDERQWQDIGDLLRRKQARLSICYVPGWVDDGDERRGRLLISGRIPSPRSAGTVYPSHLVKYQDFAGHLPGTLHDYESEYRGIQAVRAAGLGDVEMHGFTHMHPDTAAWSRAPDRYRNSQPTFWYRELRDTSRAFLARLSAEQHPLSRSASWFRKYFGLLPSTLVCPGDDWTNEALELALDLGINLVDSYYLALRDQGRLCWTTHVCAPYLDVPDPKWFDGGLPVVGYFHDREPAVEGLSWLARNLDAWHAAGAKRFMDFRELSAAVSTRLAIRMNAGSPRLVIGPERPLDWVRSLAIRIRLQGQPLPETIVVETCSGRQTVSVESIDEQTGRVVFPAKT